MLNIFTGSGVGSSILYISISIFLGLILGKIKIAKISLGITWVLFVGIVISALGVTLNYDMTITWVLFVGIVISALGVTLNYDMLHVVRELGLILFVTAVGLQVGPGFFSSFKKGGLAMNIMALVNAALGVAVTIVIAKVANQSLIDMAGVYTGAITNTPGLSAAQQVVAESGDLDAANRLAAGYAVSYPLAVVGMIMTCLVIRAICKVDLSKEPTTETLIDLKTEKSATPTSQRHKANIIPIFVFISIGIVLGSIPIPVGMSAPIKLGMAGGPLVVAIIGSWLGVKQGWFDTEFTDSHGVWMLREVGILMFLAGVGLGAGGKFVDTVQEHYMWVVYGVIITIVPPMIVATFGRLVLKINFYTLMGFIGGSHTDPPTLAFANSLAPHGCKLPNMGYATVYPLTMCLRILTAQLLVLLAM